MRMRGWKRNDDPKQVIARRCRPADNGCWLWTGSLRRRDGYGQVGFQNRLWRAHRLSWFAFRGDPGTVHVLHTCDVRSCVNPNHLYLGTPADNALDKAIRNPARGEDSPTAKLTEKQVLDIRARAARGERQKALAAEFGVGYTTVQNVVHRHTWWHV